jgi:protein tyrosine/serine phosphatase
MKRTASILLKTVGILLGIVLVYAGWNFWQGNYHTLLEGEVYRAGILTGEQLEHHVKQDGIRSIINLQGKDDDEQWYRDEIEIARANNIQHVDFKLSAYRKLTDEQLQQLVTLMKEQPKPLLIHCMGGADRTSLASALYLYAIKGEPVDNAADQLSVLYGHFPYLSRSGVSAMDESFERYVTTLNPPPVQDTP